MIYNAVNMRKRGKCRRTGSLYSEDLFIAVCVKSLACFGNTVRSIITVHIRQLATELALTSSLQLANGLRLDNKTQFSHF